MQRITCKNEKDCDTLFIWKEQSKKTENFCNRKISILTKSNLSSLDIKKNGFWCYNDKEIGAKIFFNYVGYHQGKEYNKRKDYF